LSEANPEAKPKEWQKSLSIVPGFCSAQSGLLV
jgi:hypothetical protein